MDDAIPIKRTRKKMPPGYWKEYSMKRRRAKGIMPKKPLSEEEKKRRHSIAVKRWQEKNREHFRSVCREYSEANPHVKRMHASKRRAEKRAGIAIGHNRSVEKTMMQVASRVSRCLGVKHEVDHIIPLSKGGPHHHLNMQVLPKKLNASKQANYFWDAGFLEYKTWRDVPSEFWPEKLAGQYRAMMRVESLFAA